MRRGVVFGWLFLWGTLVCSYAQLNMPLTKAGIGFPVLKAPNGFAGAPALATSAHLYSGINYANPASYAGFYSASFDVGLRMESVDYKYNPQQGIADAKNYYQIDFTNVHIGFPIKAGKIGFTLGVYPFARLGYKVGYRNALANSTEHDTVANISSGSGASQVLHLGLGVKINSYVSVGVNLGYLWGAKRSVEQKIMLHGNYNSPNVTSDLFFGSLYGTIGVMGKIPFKKTHSILWGATFSSPLFTPDTRLDGYFGTVYSHSLIDTVAITNQPNMAMGLPTSYEVGVSYANPGGQLVVGVQFKQTHWSQFFIGTRTPQEGIPYNLNDDWYMSAGLSFRPFKDLTNTTTTKRSYFGYATYSLGASYGVSRLKETSSGERPSEYGFSIGGQFPLKKYNYSNQFGAISVNLKYDTFGGNHTLFSYHIFTLQVGFLLNDIWFLKRKFD